MMDVYFPMMRVLIYHADQCDRRRCTGARLIRSRQCEEARPLSRLRHTVLLDPYGDVPLSPADREEASRRGLGLIDASWSHAREMHERFRARISRRLPHLLPVNPMNYGRRSMLTSAEAVSGALFILGEGARARAILGTIKWGPHFEEVNSHLLERYAGARSPDEILRIESEEFRP